MSTTDLRRKPSGQCGILSRKETHWAGLREHGLFLAFEGIDGAGKTTQVHLLSRALIEIGEQPVRSKEPTTGTWGQKIRQSAADGRMTVEDELDAFIKDRTEHVQHVIEPNLKADRVVLLDRYFYSTIAYQGSRGADVAAVEAKMRRFPVPDAVFLLDISSLDAIERIAHSRGEQPNEFERAEDLERARRVFNSLTDPHIVHIDGTLPIDAVHHRIVEHLVSRVFADRGDRWLRVAQRLKPVEKVANL